MELKWEDFISITAKLKSKGLKAVTITGGGEPLLYPMINEMIECLSIRNISTGLVTNGILLSSKLKHKNFNKLTWCRISCSSEYKIDFRKSQNSF